MASDDGEGLPLTAEAYAAMLVEDFDWLEDTDRQAIAEMRAELLERGRRVPEEMPELGGPLRLLRFIQGYDFDVGKATELYESMMVWRAKKGVDTIRAWLLERWNDDIHQIEGVPQWDAVQACVPTRQNVRSDRSPHVFVIESTGKINAAALVEVGETEYKAYTMYVMEHKSILLDRLSREQRMVVKTSQIRDMVDAPITSWLYNRGAFPMTQSTIKMAQGAYPETVDKIFVVHAPWLMSKVWGIVQSWMAPKTREKVFVFASDEEANAELAKHLALEDVFGATPEP
jgi:hypothetical protein